MIWLAIDENWHIFESHISETMATTGAYLDQRTKRCLIPAIYSYNREGISFLQEVATFEYWRIVIRPPEAEKVDFACLKEHAPDWSNLGFIQTRVITMTKINCKHLWISKGNGFNPSKFDNKVGKTRFGKCFKKSTRNRFQIGGWTKCFWTIIAQSSGYIFQPKLLNLI